MPCTNWYTNLFLILENMALFFKQIQSRRFFGFKRFISYFSIKMRVTENYYFLTIFKITGLLWNVHTCKINKESHFSDHTFTYIKLSGSHFIGMYSCMSKCSESLHYESCITVCTAGILVSIWIYKDLFCRLVTGVGRPIQVSIKATWIANIVER